MCGKRVSARRPIGVVSNTHQRWNAIHVCIRWRIGSYDSAITTTNHWPHGRKHEFHAEKYLFCSLISIYKFISFTERYKHCTHHICPMSYHNKKLILNSPSKIPKCLPHWTCWHLPENKKSVHFICTNILILSFLFLRLLNSCRWAIGIRENATRSQDVGVSWLQIRWESSECETYILAMRTLCET